LTAASVPSESHTERFLTPKQKIAFDFLEEGWKVKGDGLGQMLANLYYIHRNLVETKWVPLGKSKRRGVAWWRLSPLGVAYKAYLKDIGERNHLPQNGPKIDPGRRIATPRMSKPPSEADKAARQESGVG
jgi:hypothetical protein